MPCEVIVLINNRFLDEGLLCSLVVVISVQVPFDAKNEI